MPATTQRSILPEQTESAGATSSPLGAPFDFCALSVQSQPRAGVSRRAAGLGVLGLLSAAVAACGGGGDEAAIDNPQGASPGPAPAPAPSPGPAPSPAPSTSTASLGWSAPDDNRIQGYRVYYGSSSRSYSQARGAGIDVGASVSWIVPGLVKGRTYYFAVTAYDGARTESDYSAEASKTIT
jgi:hypothetical protein